LLASQGKMWGFQCKKLVYASISFFDVLIKEGTGGGNVFVLIYSIFSFSISLVYLIESSTIPYSYFRILLKGLSSQVSNTNMFSKSMAFGSI